MWMPALPWDTISQGALSEAIGALAATGLASGGSWLVRCVRRRRRSKTATATAAPLPPLPAQDSRTDA